MRVILLTLALLAGALAGCLSEDGDNDTTGDGSGITGSDMRPVIPEDFLPEGNGHDHNDAASHQFLWNYEMSSWDSLQGNQLNMAGLHALARAGDILVGAVYGSHAVSADGGVVVWDISDAANPVLLGSVTVPGYVGGDRSIGISADGTKVVLGLETLTCFGHVNPNPFTAVLIDISVPTIPLISDVLTLAETGIGNPLPQGGVSLGTHAVFVYDYEDTTIAYLSGKAYALVDGPTGPLFEERGAGDIRVAHDMYIRELPNGDIWALAANGGDDFVVLNVNDPMDPFVVGQFEVEGPYYLHTADVHMFDDGQVVLLVNSEDWEDHVSPMWIFDGTELLDVQKGEDPVVLEAQKVWSNPFDKTALGLSFSLHNPRFGDDGLLTISSYHAGLMQLDFRQQDWRMDPALIGYAVYTENAGPILEDPIMDVVETNLCGLGIGIDLPTFTDVELGDDGVLYAADVWTGLYTFRPTASHPVYGS